MKRHNTHGTLAPRSERKGAGPVPGAGELPSHGDFGGPEGAKVRSKVIMQKSAPGNTPRGMKTYNEE